MNQQHLDATAGSPPQKDAIEAEQLDFVELGVSGRSKFIEAWESSFGRRLAPEVYEWIFGDRNRLFAVMSKQEVVAGYGLMPAEAVVSGEPARIALCNNVFVTPDYRSRMLFSKLGRHALQAMGRDGFALAYGMPNAEAVPGHRRVGWSMEPLPFLARKRIDAPLPASSNVRWQEQAPSDAWLQALERCSRRSAVGRSLSMIKTEEFARWRYIQRPGVNYRFGFVADGNELRAYAVAKIFEPRNHLHVIDIDGDDPAAVEALIASLDSVEESFADINLWAATAHRALFEANGYFPSTETSTLILIDPASLTGRTKGAAANVVLADNDVF